MAAATRRQVLELARARVEANVRTLLERDEADAVELSLEGPVGAGESLLGERRRHGLDPLGKYRGRGTRRVDLVWLCHRCMTESGAQSHNWAPRPCRGRVGWPIFGGVITSKAQAEHHVDGSPQVPQALGCRERCARTLERPPLLRGGAPSLRSGPGSPAPSGPRPRSTSSSWVAPASRGRNR